jgi:hypothetical protein
MIDMKENKKIYESLEDMSKEEMRKELFESHEEIRKSLRERGISQEYIDNLVKDAIKNSRKR